jgi:hypothetical protein
MSDLTAIDVLIDPDAATMERARAVNARMLQSLPQGWALDDTHQRISPPSSGTSAPPTSARPSMRLSRRRRRPI